uniref:Putative secreted protein n=1 Tax=Psorophora albipes TaxID=869069 RepID=T1D5E6_9DIPT
MCVRVDVCLLVSLSRSWFVVLCFGSISRAPSLLLPLLLVGVHIHARETRLLDGSGRDEVKGAHWVPSRLQRVSGERNKRRDLKKCCYYLRSDDKHHGSSARECELVSIVYHISAWRK